MVERWRMVLSGGFERRKEMVMVLMVVKFEEKDVNEVGVR